MKKILAVCLALVMVFSLGITAFAAPNGFVSSPSENGAPELDSFVPSDEDCEAEIIITAYADREELPEELRDLLEEAYAEVVDADDLTTLSEALKKLAAKKNIKAENLLVSDLFDIHATGCDNHDEHREFVITLNADTLKNFVGLLHKKDNGSWELIDDAKVVNDGTALKFTVDSFSPFAIVVNKGVTSPQTNDSMVITFVALAFVSALAIIVISKKRIA